MQDSVLIVGVEITDFVQRMVNEKMKLMNGKDSKKYEEDRIELVLQSIECNYVNIINDINDRVTCKLLKTRHRTELEDESSEMCRYFIDFVQCDTESVKFIHQRLSLILETEIESFVKAHFGGYGLQVMAVPNII